MTLKLLLIYNPAAGFFIGWKPMEIETYFNSVIETKPTVKVKYLAFGSKNKKRINQVLDETRFDAIWVAGGDGTIIYVASLLLSRNIPLGILPCGTMNLLARDLGISLDVKQAISQLVEAEPVFIDKGRANALSFLNICNIGISTHFTRLREKFRHRSIWIRWPSLLWYMVRSVFIYPGMVVELKINGETHKFKTRSVSISANPLDRNSILFPSRKHLDQGKLGFYIAQDRSIWTLPVLMIKLLMGNWSYDEDLTQFSAAEAVIVPKHRRKLKVMIDGELYRLKKPLTFTIQPKSIKVLRPVK